MWLTPSSSSYSSPLGCTPVLHPRATPLCCTPVLHPCAAPLCLTSLLHPCATPLCCTPSAACCARGGGRRSRPTEVRAEDQGQIGCGEGQSASGAGRCRQAHEQGLERKWRAGMRQGPRRYRPRCYWEPQPRCYLASRSGTCSSIHPAPSQSYNPMSMPYLPHGRSYIYYYFFSPQTSVALGVLAALVED